MRVQMRIERAGGLVLEKRGDDVARAPIHDWRRIRESVPTRTLPVPQPQQSWPRDERHDPRSSATSAAMETDFGGEIVKSKNTRRFAASPPTLSLRVVFCRWVNRLPELGCRFSQSERNASARDGAFKAEANCTFAHPHALHATILRVVIACAKVLLKVALRIGEVGLRFR